jgi:hypothetical protein
VILPSGPIRSPSSGSPATIVIVILVHGSSAAMQQNNSSKTQMFPFGHNGADTQEWRDYLD